MSIGDLDGERMVAPLATSTMRPVFDALFRRNGVEPDVVAEGATNEQVLELVREAVCTVTFARARRPSWPGAVALQITDHPPNNFLLITRTRQDPTPAAVAFRELARERYLG